MTTLRLQMIILTVLFYSLGGYAQDNQAQYEKIQKEKEKIQNYIDSGVNSPEMRAELDRITQEENALKEIIDKEKRKSQVITPPVKKIVKKVVKKSKKKKVKKNKKKRKLSKYLFDKSTPLIEQIQQVLSDLETQQKVLLRLEKRKYRGVAGNSIDDQILFQKNKILQIQIEKTKLDRKIANNDQDKSVEAEDSKKNLKLGAMIDFYYLYSPGRAQEGTNISNRNYDRKNNDFTLNLFELNVEGQIGNTTLNADLDFGDFADQNQGHSGDGVNHNIGQAYLTYTFNKYFSMSAGKMYTHVGYEVAKAMDNMNYSRSYAFSLAGPFWHDGVAFKYSSDNGVSSGIFIYDNWDSSTENNKEKTYGVQVGYANEKFHFLFNIIKGPEGTEVGKHKSVYEFNTQYAVSDSVSLALNGVQGVDSKSITPNSGTTNEDKKWSAIVSYLNWQMSDKWSLTPRYEIFKDDTVSNASSFIFGSEADTLNSLTLTGTYAIDSSSELRIEYRTDSAKQKLWTDEDGKAQKKLDTMSLAWLVNI